MPDKTMRNDDESDMPMSDAELLRRSDLSPALERTIAAKLERGELDEVDADVFRKNMRKTLEKRRLDMT